jgi:hypothetical protein
VVVINLIGSRGTDSADSSLIVNVNNTSANKLISDAKNLIDQAVVLGSFTQEKSVFYFINNLNFKSGKASRSNMMHYSADFNSLAQLSGSHVAKGNGKAIKSHTGWMGYRTWRKWQSSAHWY